MNPGSYRGKHKKKNYFEGWYLKHVSADKSQVLSFIPGISLSRDGNHCFIQVIDGIRGQTWYIRYPLETFEPDFSSFSVTVGDSLFSQEGCRIRIETDDVQISGELFYENAVEYPRSLAHPGIMGWFSFIPGMELQA